MPHIVPGKLNDFEGSIEHSGEVNLEKFKAIERDVSHINGTLNQAKKHRQSFTQNRGKVLLLTEQFLKK